MRNEDIKREDFSGEMPQRAVSLYGQNDGMEDFPILKAFQQYIDAEQEKARKRIVWLGVCFGAVLVIVIVVFMFLLYGINMRNQTLSDRLVEYAMNEAGRRQVDDPAKTSQNDAAIKAITETLQSFQKKIEERNTPPVEADATRKPDDETDRKLARAKALLETEKQRLAIEKERLHQIEVEQQRRRLYPELYETGGSTASKNTPRLREKSRTLTDEDIREIIREAYPDRESVKEPTPGGKTKNAEDSDRDEKRADEDKSAEEDGGAIEYFKEDNYTIPVDIKGSKSKVKFTIPIE